MVIFMNRKDEFDDDKVKKGVIDYFIARLNGKEIEKYICVSSFEQDDRSFCKGRMSVFDGYCLEKIVDEDAYYRHCLIEVKERFKEYDNPLIEFKKIDKWLEHYDKWKEFYYLNLLPSGLWCLPVHNLGLLDWKDNLHEIKMDGISPYNFDRNAPRKGGEVLKSDRNKMALIVDKKYWIKCDDFRRNDDE